MHVAGFVTDFFVKTLLFRPGCHTRHEDGPGRFDARIAKGHLTAADQGLSEAPQFTIPKGHGTE